MANVTEVFISTGTYSIRNVASGNTIALAKDSQLLTSGPTSAPASELGDKWIITLTSNKKHTIRNARTGEYAACEPGYGAGDNVYSQPYVQEWVIKQVQTGVYQIYSRSNIQLLWGYPNAQAGSALEFSRERTSNTTYWTIRKEADVNAFGVPGQMGPLPVPIEGATRPAEKPIKDNNVEITVPKGWLAIVSGVSRGEAINQIYLQSVNPIGKTADIYQYFNQWSDLGKPLKLKDLEQQAYQVSAEGGPIVLALTFFGTTDKGRKDPFVLSAVSQNASKLSVVYVDRSIDDRNFPDYRTYYVTSDNGTYGTNAVVTVHVFKKENDLTHPEKPEEGTVNPGYPTACDDPRPQCLDEYLRHYDAVFLVDDSGSMAGQRWSEVRTVLTEIANEAVQYDGDGIGMLFLNSPLRSNVIRGQDALLNIFDNASASGNTPTGARLDVILGEYIARLDAAIGKPDYGRIKPLDLIVITDGVPTDRPKPVLEKWAAHLDAKKHHPNIVGIQFVQIGNDNGAGAALIDLTQGRVRNMVDTVPYNGSLTPERMTRVLLGGIMPSIRAKQQASLKP